MKQSRTIKLEFIDECDDVMEFLTFKGWEGDINHTKVVYYPKEMFHNYPLNLEDSRFHEAEVLEGDGLLNVRFKRVSLEVYPEWEKLFKPYDFFKDIKLPPAKQ